jgi:hypothetical protein
LMRSAKTRMYIMKQHAWNFLKYYYVVVVVHVSQDIRGKF